MLAIELLVVNDYNPDWLLIRNQYAPLSVVQELLSGRQSCWQPTAFSIRE